MMHMLSPATGRYKMNIIHWTYDSTISDERITQTLDSLPGYLFNAKMYNILYSDDTTRQAVKVNEGTYFFHVRFTVVTFYKNGSKKNVAYVNKHHEKYWEFSYNDNETPEECGHFKNGHKSGKWKYFNTDGKKVKVEKYASDGTVKSTKTYNPPKKCLKTIFNPKHPLGAPYIII
jgi:hypothetical protein